MLQIAKFNLSCEAEMAKLAASLAGLVQIGDVVALRGDLGAGKTAFARAFIRAVCRPDEDVPSPTFTLVQYYDAPLFSVYHFDLYRLEDPDEAFELGIDDAFASGVSLIEWPDRLGGYLPANCLDLELHIGADEGSRTVTVRGDPPWTERLESLSLD